MTTERDELADHLADSIFRYTGVTTSSSKSMADELLAAGYRKPQQVATAEELAALPNMSVVRSKAGSIVNLTGGRAYIFGTEGSAPASSLALPATVLHVGGAE